MSLHRRFIKSQQLGKLNGWFDHVAERFSYNVKNFSCDSFACLWKEVPFLLRLLMRSLQVLLEVKCLQQIRFSLTIFLKSSFTRKITLDQLVKSWVKPFTFKLTHTMIIERCTCICLTLSLLACLTMVSHPTCCIITGTTAWAFFLTSPLRSSKQEYRGATTAARVEGRFFSTGNFSSNQPNTWRIQTKISQEAQQLKIWERKSDNQKSSPTTKSRFSPNTIFSK